jgi:ABC-type multidrug transport system ATPase subunit
VRMSLLELEHVCKSYGRPPREQVALQDVCLELDAGEMAAVWGMRRSGRSTLLRVAAGVEPPDGGTVRLEGRDLHARGGRALPGRIAYCRKLDSVPGAPSVLDELLKDPLSLGVEPGAASGLIRRSLERAGADECSKQRLDELDGAQRVRVQVARALLRAPKLIVIDEPTLGVSLRQRDEVIALLRSLADEGIAVLQSTDNNTGFLGADRSLTIDRGRLRGETVPGLAEVVPLRKLA